MTPTVRATATLAALVLACAAVVPALASDEDVVATPGDEHARALLWQGVTASSRPHVGEVSTITFGVDGPRIATVAVRVGAMGAVERRQPTRWVLGGPEGALVRSGPEVALLTPAGGSVGLDVEALLSHRRATVGAPVELDTGPAVPVLLVRTIGAAVQETFHVDVATGVLVRRETRGADGRVLRVVAYTRLAPVPTSGPGPVAGTATPAVAASDAVAAGAADGTLPAVLGGGFAVAARGREGAVRTARYTDGLSVLSVYAQDGRLDVAALRDARVVHLAGRDVWTWPGSEPTRLVWTGDGRTWTAVTDAPLEVVADALGSLPGERVPHDLGSRLVRGCLRVVDALRDAAGV